MLHIWYGCPLFNCTEKVGTHHFARQTDRIFFFRRVVSFIVLKIVTVRGCAAEGKKREGWRRKMEMLYSWEQSDTKTQINPFTTNHYAFILLFFFFWSKNSLGEMLSCQKMLLLTTLLASRNNSREAGIQAESFTASYKQMDHFLSPTSYDVLKAGKELSLRYLPSGWCRLSHQSYRGCRWACPQCIASKQSIE